MNTEVDEITETAGNDEINLPSSKSANLYEKTYNRFMTYCEEKKIDSFSESVMLTYFSELSNKMKSSTLWANYSMLKATISAKHNIDISKYVKLRSFLKTQSDGYQSTQSRILERHQIQKFLLEAPDDKYLAKKVALIIGVAGGCRCDELLHMKIDDIEDLGNKLLITLPDNKSKKTRSFLVTDHLDIIRKYAACRPPHLTNPRFFFQYLNGKATGQLIGVHKLGEIPEEIATYLELPNAKEYTGRCFRRSAALLGYSGFDINMFSGHSSWNPSVTEDQVEEQTVNEIAFSNVEIKEEPIANDILPNVEIKTENNDSVRSETFGENTWKVINIKRSKEEQESPILFNNCSHFIVNIYNEPQ